MILRCAIIDDEPIARKLLEEYIGETDFLTLAGTAENPLKAIGLISREDVDLIFLDINMPKMNGLDFLKSAVHLPMVIMTTAYGQHALEGFEMAVIDYLVKPFSLERFVKACQKALEIQSLKQLKLSPGNVQPEYFFVKCEGKIKRVIVDELVYVEAMSNYITLHMLQEKMIVYLTMKGILEKLPPEKFLQTHKSYIININRIRAIEGNLLDLGSTKIAIGLHFYDGVIERILKDRLLKR
jgi:DNA-binding LytR/AlgR family response regulator